MGRLMSFSKRVISIDKSYVSLIKSFKPIDGLLALLVPLLWVFAFYWGARIYAVVSVPAIDNLIATLIVAAVTLAFVCIRRQNLSTLGFSTKNVIPSLRVGLVLGVAFFCVRMWYFYVNGFRPFSISSASEFFLPILIFFILISFSEELTFRAYMQPRIYALFKSDFPAIITVGIICAVLHMVLPAMAITILSNRGIEHEPAQHFNLVTILELLCYHVLLNWLYRKYNSIVGPVVLHGFINLHFML